MMSMIFTVVARTAGGWRSPPTIPAMTLEEAKARCQDLCKRFPNQEFDILGVVAQGKRTSNVMIEATEPAVLDAKRSKKPMAEELGTVTALRG